MRRRDFITLLGGTAVAWPPAARAQTRLPVIGLLSSFSPTGGADTLAAFRQGLSNTGFVEHQNIGIEYRWAEGQYDRLPAMAADLVRRQVSAIVALVATPAALAAKAATISIPIVFSIGGDPVELGLVASLNRPGGNITGVTWRSTELIAKGLEIIVELVPGSTLIAALVNPANPNTEIQSRDLHSAARMLGRKVHVLNAGTDREIDLAFATLTHEGAGALLVAPDGLFFNQRDQIVALASRYKMPALYSWPEYVRAGGLMSYGSSLSDANRLVGVYTSQILKGAKPADLPVVQSTKVELLINSKTAKALGLDVPPTLLARADEVIE
jgi:putative tryptophan/tyrosine transport system substrate-binding protein